MCNEICMQEINPLYYLKTSAKNIYQENPQYVTKIRKRVLNLMKKLEVLLVIGLPNKNINF